ncbi:MAG: hypothetical protein JO061_01290 [Acidobacteriaceae bacterium]|nr:hypothetical protein [Acidobacteriaceae bacterium]
MIGFAKALFQRFKTALHTPSPPDPHTSLRGAPARARIKTYSAATGYVYQYVFRGYRASFDASGTEYVFSVTRNGQTHPIAILLRDADLQQCAALIARPVLNQERYALSKMTLFSVFDQATDFDPLETPVAPTASEMHSHLQTLGRT